MWFADLSTNYKIEITFQAIYKYLANEHTKQQQQPKRRETKRQILHCRWYTNFCMRTSGNKNQTFKRNWVEYTCGMHPCLLSLCVHELRAHLAATYSLEMWCKCCVRVICFGLLIFFPWRVFFFFFFFSSWITKYLYFMVAHLLGCAYLFSYKKIQTFHYFD